jgi:hypothetical protein
MLQDKVNMQELKEKENNKTIESMIEVQAAMDEREKKRGQVTKDL